MKAYERAPQKISDLGCRVAEKHAYHYVVHEITKGGWLHRGRYATWVSPNNRITIETCTEPLDGETTRTATGMREKAKAYRADALERGSLELFDEELKRSRW